MTDPANDTMQDRLEEKVRNLLLASAELAGLEVFYRGEPGIVPVKLYPFATVFLDTKREATGEEGYGQQTGVTNFRYDGYVAFEVLFKDTTRLVPDADRKANVQSYIDAKTLAEAGFNALWAWGGPMGVLEGDPVVSFDTKEASVELRTDNQHNGAADRGNDNANNRSSFEFHIYTRRLDF
jgi:hypothetical protein